MSSGSCVRVASARGRGIKAAVGGLAACLSLPHAAEAQQTTTELPPIEVTTQSPVKRAPKKQASAPSSTPASGATQPLPGQVDAAAFQPPPGTLIVSTDAFVSVTVATERDLQANGGPTITDTLQTKPGITGSNFAAGANRPIIRGLDNYRVRVQEDGIGTHDVSALSEDHAVPIDPNAADRVEVVRGPATLRYGSQAIGGVVSAENDRSP